jgi:23S rRNA (guanosine2251-2'-O)-methyltransferase
VEEYEFRQCEWQGCRFRFPVEIEESRLTRCPRCGAATEVAGSPVAGDVHVAPAPVEPAFSALLDNIRSIHNVGSMFRTADGAGLHHLYLCGITATPAHLKLGKTALGAQDSVPWSYGLNGVDLSLSLKEKGYQLWAIEDADGAEPFFSANLALNTQQVVIVVGNERAGIDPGIIDLCDRILYLPMAGHKHSLNVAVVFGIVSYHLRYAQLVEKSRT